MNKKIIILVTILICLCTALITAQHFSNIHREENTAHAVFSSSENSAPTADSSKAPASDAQTQKPFSGSADAQSEKPSSEKPQTSKAAERPTAAKTTTQKTTVGKTAGASRQPTTKPTATAHTSTQKQTFTVTFSINAETASAYGKNLPQDGLILPPVKLSAEQGETVFSLLEKICGEKNISLKYQTKSYIQGIGGLSEKDCGAGSGWVYKVNGEKPAKPANKYAVSEGDVIEWYYVTSPTD